MPSLLAEQAVTLAPEAQDQLLDIIEDELVAALALLRRRAGGDYGIDTRPNRFPAPGLPTQKASGLGCWDLFEAWVKQRQAAAATVNRWRSVFLALEREFTGTDIGALTNNDAIRWKGTLVTEDRSPVVANDIWLTAARTVFEWAKNNKLVTTNPFEGVSIAVSHRVQEVREREFTDSEWPIVLRGIARPWVRAYDAASSRGTAMGTMALRLYRFTAGRGHSAAGRRRFAASSWILDGEDYTRGGDGQRRQGAYCAAA